MPHPHYSVFYSDSLLAQIYQYDQKSEDDTNNINKNDNKIYPIFSLLETRPNPLQNWGGIVKQGSRAKL